MLVTLLDMHGNHSSLGGVSRMDFLFPTKMKVAGGGRERMHALHHWLQPLLLVADWYIPEQVLLGSSRNWQLLQSIKSTGYWAATLTIFVLCISMGKTIRPIWHRFLATVPGQAALVMVSQERMATRMVPV